MPAWPEHTEKEAGQQEMGLEMQKDRVVRGLVSPWKDLALTWAMGIQCRALNGGFLFYFYYYYF